MDQIAIPGATVYAASVVEQSGSSYFLCRIDATGVLEDLDPPHVVTLLVGLPGERRRAAAAESGHLLADHGR